MNKAIGPSTKTKMMRRRMKVWTAAILAATFFHPRPYGREEAAGRGRRSAVSASGTHTFLPVAGPCGLRVLRHRIGNSQIRWGVEYVSVLVAGSRMGWTPLDPPEVTFF